MSKLRASPLRRQRPQGLYERHAAKIQSYCLHQLGSREEAEDAVQTTFMNAFRALGRGIVPEAESAWLFKIAENVCLSRRRSSWRRGRIESPSDFEIIEEIIPGPSRQSDELIGIEDALASMPEQQRRAILLREWQGLSYREIAEELEVTQSAVETLIFRARRSLAAGARAAGLGQEAEAQELPPRPAYARHRHDRRGVQGAARGQRGRQGDSCCRGGHRRRRYRRVREGRRAFAEGGRPAPALAAPAPARAAPKAAAAGDAFVVRSVSAPSAAAPMRNGAAEDRPAAAKTSAKPKAPESAAPTAPPIQTAAPAAAEPPAPEAPAEQPAPPAPEESAKPPVAEHPAPAPAARAAEARGEARKAGEEGGPGREGQGQEGVRRARAHRCRPGACRVARSADCCSDRARSGRRRADPQGVEAGTARAEEPPRSRGRARRGDRAGCSRGRADGGSRDD